MSMLVRRSLLGGHAKMRVPHPPVRRLTRPSAIVSGLATRACLEDNAVAALVGEVVGALAGIRGGVLRRQVTMGIKLIRRHLVDF